MDDSKQEMIDLTCTSAIYEKGVNFYEVDFAVAKPSCILLDNSPRIFKGSKVSHAVKDVKECSQTNDEYKIDQIIDQNNDPNGDNKENKIRKLLRAKYDKAKREGQNPIASVLANEVNYEFDINVLSASQSARYFKMFREQNINPDICQGSNESRLNKKSKVIDNSANISNQANKHHESGFVVPENVLDRSKGKQPESTGRRQNAGVQSPNYFAGESSSNSNSVGNGSSSFLSDNESSTNVNISVNVKPSLEAVEQMDDYSKYFWNDEEDQNLGNP
uniref:Uncharacterized protein n=1 Tax=Meloidogyne javanica TaxID=6303 RepID=A0A915MDM6_MELJA